MSIKQNITSLQSLLERVNELPEAENLDTEISTQTELISEQDAKIAELAQVLAGKAGGGSASYDTCTVYIATVNGALYGYCFTCFDGENIVYKQAFSNSNLGTIAIEDVICGSSFSLIHQIYGGAVNCSNVTLVGTNSSKGSVFVAPYNGSAHIDIGNSNGGAV